MPTYNFFNAGGASARPQFYLVVDLEATCCDDDSIAEGNREIIEIGAVIYDNQFQEVSQFQTFVKPVIHTQLTDFCTELTSIKQADVDAAPVFSDALKLFKRHLFADDHGRDYTFCSWGSFDGTMLDKEVQRHTHQKKFNISKRVNLKTALLKRHKVSNADFGSLDKACDKILGGMTGAHHRALDDAINTARLLPYILGDETLPKQGKTHTKKCNR